MNWMKDGIPPVFGWLSILQPPQSLSDFVTRPPARPERSARKEDAALSRQAAKNSVTVQLATVVMAVTALAARVRPNDDSRESDARGDRQCKHFHGYSVSIVDVPRGQRPE
jgi:hypothetical protein